MGLRPAAGAAGLPGWHPGAPALPLKVALAVGRGAAAFALAALAWPLNRVAGLRFPQLQRRLQLVDRRLCRRRRPAAPPSGVVLVVYGGLLYLTWWSFDKAPSGFIPMQDKGYLLVNVQLPDAASRAAHR